jgi:hypothetical protein
MNYLFKRGLKSIFLLLLAMPLAYSNPLSAQISVDTTITIEELVENYFIGGPSSGIEVFNITFNGMPASNLVNIQVGSFTGGQDVFGINNGIILATGLATLAEEANTSDQAGSDIGTFYFDADLAAIATSGINNAAVLEFDFIPTGTQLEFGYSLASEEYNEFVFSQFNDVFGIWLTLPDGTKSNVAIAPDGSAVAINNVNSSTNSGNYQSNDLSDGFPLFYPDFQYDGFTKFLKVDVPVISGDTHHIKLAICDVGDGIYDSGIFLEGNFVSLTEPTYINEFMASNESALPGPEGNYPDWIEIYNAGENPIMLGGYYISDDLTDTSAWYQIPNTYPDSVTVAPDDFILFYANKNETASVLNLNFKLSGSGEQIGLWNPEQLVVDSLTFQDQFTDTSFGRIPNGEEKWVFFSNTTPHSTNTEGVIVSPLVINEFMASNDSWNIPGESEFEPFPDWIEIYNTSNTVINMAGWYVTDDLTDAVKYQLPTDDPLLTTIPAHGFLILY